MYPKQSSHAELQFYSANRCCFFLLVFFFLSPFSFHYIFFIMRPGEQNQKRPLNGSSGKPLTKKARIARPVIAGTKASQARAEAIRSGLANATSSSSIVPSSKPAAKRFKKDNVEEDSRSHAQILSAFKNRLKWDIRVNISYILLSIQDKH
jgi:hypothetical protein